LCQIPTWRGSRKSTHALKPVWVELTHKLLFPFTKLTISRFVTLLLGKSRLDPQKVRAGIASVLEPVGVYETERAICRMIRYGSQECLVVLH
jgi:hypothetical protein